MDARNDLQAGQVCSEDFVWLTVPLQCQGPIAGPSRLKSYPGLSARRWRCLAVHPGFNE